MCVNNERFQHYTSDYFTEDSKRSQSTSDQKRWCIYRVPSKLRNVNAAAYTPRLLSIGLFRYGKPELKDMEKHKQIYSDNFRKRCLEGKDKLPAETQKVDMLRNFIKDSRGSIFSCYAGTIDLSVNEDEVVEIILVDACFIIELFLRNCETECHGQDYILSSPWLKKAIELELILFENQLPYSLLQDLYELVQAVPYSFLQLTWEEMTWVKTINSKYSITMLTTAGVNFMPAGEYHEHLVIKIDDFHAPERVNEKEASKRKLNLARFRSMNLKLTPFRVKNETECIVRNVMALEQFVYPQEAYVCNFFLMMDKLVDNVEDVDFLVEKGVIVNMLGSNRAVVQLVNKLCDHIMEEKSCYTHICEKLNRRYDCSLNRHLVSLKRVYFKDVWTGSATFF
ncbi:hypothetical protein ACLB2K_073878 [Fragaria x ananassa]